MKSFYSKSRAALFIRFDFPTSLYHLGYRLRDIVDGGKFYTIGEPFECFLDDNSSWIEDAAQETYLKPVKSLADCYRR